MCPAAGKRTNPMGGRHAETGPSKVHSGGPGPAGVAGGGHGGGAGPAAAVAVAGGLPPVVGMAGAGLLRHRGLQSAAHQRGLCPGPGAGGAAGGGGGAAAGAGAFAPIEQILNNTKKFACFFE